MTGPSRRAPEGSQAATEGPSDKDLVVAFKTGEQAAYDAIYRRHHQRVRAVCYRILGNSSDVEEAVQETFLRCYRALGRFNGQYQLGAWLSRIAANVAVDQLRHRARTPATTTVEAVTEFESIEPQPDGLVTDQIQMHDALEDIQPLHARALVLRALQGLSHEEMANELKLTPQQVKSLLHRARNSFRRAWKDASGWALAPFAVFRNFAQDQSRRPETNQTLVLGAASPAFTTMLERVAASAVAAALVLSGVPSSDTAETERTLRAPEEQIARRIGVDSKRMFAGADRAAPRHGNDQSPATTSPVEDLVEDVTVIVATLENSVGEARDPEEPQGRTEPSPTDPTAPSEVKEAVEKVEQEVEELTDGETAALNP